MDKPVKKYYQTKRPFDWFSLFITLFIMMMLAAILATFLYG